MDLYIFLSQHKISNNYGNYYSIKDNCSETMLQWRDRDFDEQLSDNFIQVSG